MVHTEIIGRKVCTRCYLILKNKNYGKLAKLKQKFRSSLCSTETFNFSFVQPEKIQEIINILKN